MDSATTITQVVNFVPSTSLQNPKPFKLIWPLRHVLNTQISALLANCTNNLNLLALSKQLKDLRKTSVSLDWLKAESKGYAHSVVQRLTLKNLQQGFANLCLVHSCTITNKQRGKFSGCPAFGFSSYRGPEVKSYQCRDPMCPNCFIRHVNKVVKEARAKAATYLDSATQEQMVTFVIKQNLQFLENSWGYVPCFNDEMYKKFKSAFGKSSNYLGVRTVGVVAESKRPYVANRLAIVVRFSEFEKTQKKIRSIKEELVKRGHLNIDIDVKQGLDMGVAELYDCCPFNLVACAANLQDPNLVLLIDQYRYLTSGKKRTVMFGSGAK